MCSGSPFDKTCVMSCPRPISQRSRVRHRSAPAQRFFAARPMEKSWLIAEALHKHCILPDSERVKRTGSIPPSSTLKHKKTRAAFAWARVVKGHKFFTARAVKRALKLLVTKFEVAIPRIPGQTFQVWSQAQTELILHLCQRARKNFGSSLRYAGLHFKMDNVETQMLIEEPFE